jgi:hypothetical protein
VFYTTQCRGSGMNFFGSESYFSVAVSDPTRIFSNILNINLTFVFPSCNCVRLHIITSFSWKFFLIKSKSTDARIRNDFFQDLYPNPDPAKSFGSARPVSASFTLLNLWFFAIFSLFYRLINSVQFQPDLLNLIYLFLSLVLCS